MGVCGGEGANPIEVQTERMRTYVLRIISTQQAHDVVTASY